MIQAPCAVAGGRTSRWAIAFVAVLALLAVTNRAAPMKRPLTSAVLVALVVAATHTDARACKRLGPITHEVDAAMQATDHTPPTLPGIPRAQLHYGEGSQAGCGSDCPDVGFISIPADATDDMSAAGKIGYRYTLAAGSCHPV
jgi:hypothetical protein